MEVKEGIGTTTTLTVVKLKQYKAATDMKKEVDQIMRGLPKGKKSQVSELTNVTPKDKEIRRVGEPTKEVKKVDGITYHILTYTAVRERERFREKNAVTKMKSGRKRKREHSPKKEKEGKGGFKDNVPDPESRVKAKRKLFITPGGIKEPHRSNTERVGEDVTKGEVANVERFEQAHAGKCLGPPSDPIALWSRSKMPGRGGHAAKCLGPPLDPISWWSRGKMPGRGGHP